MTRTVRKCSESPTRNDGRREKRLARTSARWHTILKMFIMGKSSYIRLARGWRRLQMIVTPTMISMIETDHSWMRLLTSGIGIRIHRDTDPIIHIRLKKIYIYMYCIQQFSWWWCLPYTRWMSIQIQYNILYWHICHVWYAICIVSLQISVMWICIKQNRITQYACKCY